MAFSTGVNRFLGGMGSGIRGKTRQYSLVLLALATVISGSMFSTQARAVDIFCTFAGEVSQYNVGFTNAVADRDQALGFVESVGGPAGMDRCFSGDYSPGETLGSLMNGVNATWVVGSEGDRQGPMRVHWASARISNFKINGVAIAPDTTVLLPTFGDRTYIFTYTEAAYGARVVRFQLNADNKTFTPQDISIFTDPAPVITGGANATVSVAENQTAVTDVQSTDNVSAEGTGITYTLTGGADQALFSIDANTGVLTFAAAPDFETPADAGADNVYDVQITASDAAGLPSTQDIAVTVTDVDDDSVPVPVPVVTTPTSAPNVAIIGAPSSTDGVSPFDVTIQFTSDVTGFVRNDITVGNGSVTAFVAVDANTYNATIMPSGKGDVTIDVAADVAVDASNNGNTAATQVTVINTVVDDTQRVVANFMHNRAYHMLSNQPKIGALLNGSNLGGGGRLGNLNLNANGSTLQLAFASSLSRLEQKSKSGKRIDHAFPVDSASSAYGETHNFDIWTEIYGSSSRAGSADSDFWVGYFGAHYFVSPEMIVGALVQVDWASETNRTANSSTEGMGWMIGPYVAGRVSGTKLSYEARVAWGRSDNDVTPNGNYTDNFETERFLASGKLSGSYRLGDWTIAPEVGISWFEEDQDAYIDSLGNLIPQQTISLGEYSFGPNFSYDIKLEDDTLLRPSFGISGVQNFGIKKGILTQGTVLGSDNLRAKFDAGLAITNQLGWNLAFTGFYDGIGISSYDAYGGSVRFTVPLN